MEFYAICRLRLCGSGLFQFPTGWNSTVARESDGASYQSFNSQRDGILQWTTRDIPIHSAFQFPTGWNSTEMRLSKAEFEKLFQFPTGWNSTILFCSMSGILSSSFNSQRDGILQHRARQLARQRRFQFPTGWNSTLSFKISEFS